MSWDAAFHYGLVIGSYPDPSVKFLSPPGTWPADLCWCWDLGKRLSIHMREAGYLFSP